MKNMNLWKYDEFIHKDIARTIFMRYDRPGSWLNAINKDGSYVYRKMKQLKENWVFIELLRLYKWKARSLWFINIFDMHKHLDEIIRRHHTDQSTNSLLTNDERLYLRRFK